MLVPVQDMALPAIKTLQDCADWSQTVQPFIPQLKELPQQVWLHMSSVEELKALYVSTNPLVTAFAFSLALAPIFLLVSELNKNYSQVDRMWSLLPTIYNAHYAAWAHMTGLPTQKVDNVLAFSVVWSLRLTFNYWRKGGYSVGSEDYRWAIIKSKVNPALFFLFNVTFISTIQSVLLWAVATPTYILLLTSRLTGQGMSTVDTIFARVLMAMVVLEYFADQQQWDYQSTKQRYLQTAQVPHKSKYTRDELDRGFTTRGLWAWSRHPNFAAEQAIWVILYQWGCLSSYTPLNWTSMGALNYLFLFQGSTWLTELLTAGKYPEYKEYQQRVGKFFPSLLGERWVEAKAPVPARPQKSAGPKGSAKKSK
ncbi:uncharacterized protein K452DRAFT_320308 [Aplosporella prunicola CBS 121167]|uniref:Steroid 5-alpha reductase C-terminal domain-containing protein n=1 Tax=Aplosporella prunicola CBS 121167 TaxID=1176127 RepID=A0A6A6B9U8_9PEZI|nr:uncharacterized protein K452DRAFT_320308 [Aplosporella prunicola CBS 121167]KAF2139687.1 hypothetical protein K452DRAFT_320308 [Aplosporella prunicola CBS 121167]